MVKIRKKIAENPIVGAIVLVLLYYGFFLASLLLYYYISYYIGLVFYNVPYVILVFLRFFIIFSLIGFLWIVIVPLGLQLPNEQQSIREYFENIKLKTDEHLKRNILLGLGCASLYGLTSFCGVLIVAEKFPSFDINILIGLPDPSTGVGVFIFFSMLTWGIWEEIAFRGVILTMLLKKYDPNKAIFIDGVFFGLYHSFNIFGGVDPILVFIQIIFTMLSGFLYAYMFVKTESLLPSIFYHYLHNVLFSIINKWFSGVLIPEPILVILVTRIFGEFIPVVLGFCIVKYVLATTRSSSTTFDHF